MVRRSYGHLIWQGHLNIDICVSTHCHRTRRGYVACDLFHHHTKPATRIRCPGRRGQRSRVRVRVLPTSIRDSLRPAPAPRAVAATLQCHTRTRGHAHSARPRSCPGRDAAQNCEPERGTRAPASELATHPIPARRTKGAWTHPSAPATHIANL